MRNILKTISHKLLIATIFSVPQICISQSNINPTKKPELSISDQLSSTENGKISLKYSKQKRIIWIESEKHHVYKLVHRLAKNTNPELVGSEDSIRFVSRSTTSHNDNEFFGLTFAERSMQGNGGGECGSGTEEYFVAYKIIKKTEIKEIYRKLIGSCIKRIDLDTGDGNNNDNSITSSKNTVSFRWLTYQNTDLYIIGTYNFLTNSISYVEYERTQIPDTP